eukprot:6305897-Alexandrium_andersonii.AAC.1
MAARIADCGLRIEAPLHQWRASCGTALALCPPLPVPLGSLKNCRSRARDREALGVYRCLRLSACGAG